MLKHTPYEYDENYQPIPLFWEEADAVYALYEQLFDSRSLCKKTVLEAMKFLVKSKEMDKQEEEMTYMQPEDLCVVHQNEINAAVEETTEEMKSKVYSVLEGKLY